MGAQTLHFQGQAVAIAVHVLDNGDLRHPVGGKPFVHHRDELIGMGLFRTHIRKGDKVNRDTVLVKSHK